MNFKKLFLVMAVGALIGLAGYNVAGAQTILPAPAKWSIPQPASGIANVFGFYWIGLYAGGQVVNDIDSPFRGGEYALTANAIVGFKKYYDLQFQVIRPLSRAPALYRFAVGIKIL